MYLIGGQISRDSVWLWFFRKRFDGIKKSQSAQRLLCFCLIQLDCFGVISELYI